MSERVSKRVAGREEATDPFNNRLHLSLLIFSIKGSISCEEEIGDYAHCPNIDGF